MDKFYNSYNPKDNGLEYNKDSENHDPLGLLGAPSKIDVPVNYNQQNVTYEIPPFPDPDGNGILDCFIEKNLEWGDNHCGYIGFKYPFAGSLIDDGAIDVVVRDWINS